MIRYLTIALICILIASCGGATGSSEDALREWLSNAEAAVEEKDRGELLAMISDRYADSRGNDREKIGNTLRVYFLRQQSIAILTSIDDISLMGESAALIKMTVGMAGTRNSSAFGINADAYEFELELELVDDDWMLIGARWGELGDNLR